MSFDLSQLSLCTTPQHQSCALGNGDTPVCTFRRGYVQAGNLSPYAAGVLFERNLPAVHPEQRLIKLFALERQLQNLYFPSFVRAFIRGRIDALSLPTTTDVVVESELPKPNNNTTTMKLKETKAVVEAFETLLGAIVSLAFAFVTATRSAPTSAADEEEEEETPPPAKKQAKKQAKAKPEPEPEDEEEEESGDEDLLDEGEEEEEEPSISIGDLKAIGQKLLKAGKADKLKAVLKKNGAENLGGLDESKYATVHAALTKALG